MACGCGMCVCASVLPHNKDEGKNSGKDDHGEQNQQNHQTQITFILRCNIWMERERKKQDGGSTKQSVWELWRKRNLEQQKERKV